MKVEMDATQEAADDYAHDAKGRLDQYRTWTPAWCDERRRIVDEIAARFGRLYVPRWLTTTSLKHDD